MPIYVAVDRDEVAGFDFAYRRGHPALGITDDLRAGLLHHLPVKRGTDPFASFLHDHMGRGR
jgi:guanine deaminase